MRVLLVADAVGGVRTFTTELVSELASRGVDLHLALIGPADPAEFEQLGASSCDVRDLRLEWMAEPWDDLKATTEWIEALAALRRPDLIHMNTFASVGDAGLPVALTVHSCVLTWWRAVHGEPAPPEWDEYARLVRAALSRADLVMAPTRAYLREVEAVHGRLPHARVIPNGRKLQASANFESRERLVVSVGRIWDSAKNVELLARAAEGIDGRVVAIGPGDIDGVEAIGAAGSREVMGWLARAAVFAAPARYEPFGLAALEAALCGCALVLGDISTLRELWDGAATFVDPDDPEALADAVNRLLKEEPERRRAAVVAHRRAQRYRPQPMADAYLEAYRSLCPVPA